MAFFSHTRKVSAVADAVHKFDDAQPEVRRWWTDAAPEFAAAARTIRSTRHLAHYRSTPYRPQAYGRAERKHRLAIQGTRCLLTTGGLSEKLWVLAIAMFAMMYNANFRGADGFSSWQRRIQDDQEFKCTNSERSFFVSILMMLSFPELKRGRTSKLQGSGATGLCFQFLLE